MFDYLHTGRYGSVRSSRQFALDNLKLGLKPNPYIEDEVYDPDGWILIRGWKVVMKEPSGFKRWSQLAEARLAKQAKHRSC
jgi:hypothetical protein